MPDGSKVFGKQINDNPDKYFTKEVLKKILIYDLWMFKKENNYFLKNMKFLIIHQEKREEI